MFIKRLLGLVMILTAVLGVCGCIAVVVLGQPVFDNVVKGIDDNLASLTSTLDTVSETLQLAQVTSSQVIVGLQTAEISVLDTAKTISETRPLVTVSSDIFTGDVAKSIDSVQATIPTLAQLAGNVDKTLSFLSKINVLGVSLGIDYNPATPLDQSITAVGDSFNGIPAKLRSMAEPFAATQDNLGSMATNLTEIGANLHDINASLAQFAGLFTKYQNSVIAAKQQLQATQLELHNSLQTIKVVVLVFFIWLGLTQLAPLYLGFQLLFARHAT